VRVRRAIAYCTDKAGLVASVYPDLTAEQRQALIADTFIRPTSWAYTAPATVYPYAPATGQALLDQAGWTLEPGATYRTRDGKELVLTLRTTTTSFRQTYLAVFEAQMQACGIRVIREHLDADWLFGGSKLTGIAVRDFELADFAWVIEDADPSGRTIYACDQIPTPANGWQGQNYVGWCNAEASAAIVTASDTTLSQTERKAAYATVINAAAADLPQLPLFWRNDPDTGQPSETWEHIDFNLETYAQDADLAPSDQTTLSITDYAGNAGSVVAPAGAVTQTTTLSYYPLVASAHVLPGRSAETAPFRLTAAVQGVRQAGFDFSAPVTLTVRYDDTSISSIREDSLNLYRWNEDTGWQPAQESCPEGERYYQADRTTNTIVTRICHLSEFSLIGSWKYKSYLPLVLRDYQDCQEAPRLLFPANGAKLDTLIPLFQWHNCPITSTAWVNLAVSTDPIMQSIVFSHGGPSSMLHESRPNHNLAPNTTYYWGVRYQYGSPDFGPYSAIWSFTTGANGSVPPAPELVAPANGSTAAGRIVTLQWAPVNEATEYLVHWRPVGYSGYGNLWLTATQAEINADHWTPPMPPGAAVEWWVAARNEYALGGDSPMWRFTLPIVYDDFNDTAWDGAYNPALWQASDTTGYDIRQSNGVLVFSNPAPAWRTVSMALKRPETRSLPELGLFEARFKLGGDCTGEQARIQLQYSAQNVAGYDEWVAQCQLCRGCYYQQANSAICSIILWKDRGSRNEYFTPGKPIDPDTWHLLRIETDSHTGNLRFYLDGSLIGSHTPEDAATLLGVTTFQPKIVAQNIGDGVKCTRYVDDVRVTPAQ